MARSKSCGPPPARLPSPSLSLKGHALSLKAAVALALEQTRYGSRISSIVSKS